MTAVPEHLLVQDALAACSALQGGRLLRWSESSSRYVCSGAADIPTAQQQLLGRTAELGWLLRTIEKLSAELAGLQPPSVVHEALVAAARREVGSYYRLVAILEAQAQQATSGSGGSSTGGSGSTGQPDGVLTLRRLQVWLAEPLGRLRVLASCLEAVRGVRGGQALNALLALSKHGDPLVRKVVAPALEEACVPYFKQISLWVLNGTLEAGSSEFLVAREALPPPLCEDPAACWRGGYRLNPAMQPRFVSDQLAGDILTTGKTIAFLREFCGDTRWAAAIGAPAQALAAGGGNYRQLRWLESAVIDVKRAVSAHLLDIVMSQQGLPRHLAAIKRYLLLGQGDFVRVLLDAARPELDRGAKEVSQYTLQGHLDAALRSCAAGEDPEVLRRVDVRLPPGKVLEGDRGWDVFSLQYHVDGPLGAVLSPEAMQAYLRIFRLLWTIKHVETVLEQCWDHINSAQRALGTLRAQEKLHGVEVEHVELVPPVLRAFHARRAEMASFVTSLQYYIAFEVLEPNWAKLTAALPGAADLDAVITLHEGTLQALAAGIFLDGLPQMLTPLGLGGAGAADVQAGLRKTLRAVLDVQGPIKRLAATVEQAVAEQAMYLQRARDSEVAGEWNAEVYNSPAIPPEVLQEISSGMGRVYALFDRHLRTFLTLLPASRQSETLDLRFFLSRFEATQAGPGGGDAGGAVAAAAAAAGME
ncbi:hypothetical protein ABPG77_003069 [Micractinium sp. CCAP 211/92]